jgi:ATP-binding cassette, subfamily B, bacterial
VQAVKVATAEEGVIRFRELNEERRRLSLRDRLFNEILNSIFHNAISLGTGVILILAGQSMQDGHLHRGRFCPVRLLPGRILRADRPSPGLLIARYRQIGVSVKRMQRLMEGAPPDALVEFSPVYLDGKFPQVTYPAKDPEHLLRLEADQLSYTSPARRTASKISA